MEMIKDLQETVYAMTSDDYKQRFIAEYAQWVYDTDGLDWGLGAWVCSSCHIKNDNIPAMKPDINPMWFDGSKFCPNCGKTMIKAEDDK